jgi:hypothetical protein
VHRLDVAVANAVTWLPGNGGTPTGPPPQLTLLEGLPVNLVTHRWTRC